MKNIMNYSKGLRLICLLQD